MASLPSDVRSDWHAIGRVNSAGFRSVSGCTGTLIAPDLVVTAAHCTQHARESGIPLHFVAGRDRSEFAAHRISAEITLNPGYDPTDEDAQFDADIAVFRLSEPITADEATPLALAQPGRAPDDQAWLLGYNNLRAAVLSAHQDCTNLPYDHPTLRLYDCEVITGNSGGAVVEADPQGWVLTAIIVARGSGAGRALVVPVNGWLYQQWRAAQARAER